MTIFENNSPSTLKISFIAVWLAPPPIQLPAIVVIPLANSSGFIKTKFGNKFFTIIIAIGPPIIIPTVPVKNIINAFEPSLLISFKSTLKVRRTNDVGSKYLEATKYRFDFSGETIPVVFNKEGIK